MAASMEQGDLHSEIRKLRKKLRQIENLQRLNRELTEEEEIKVSKKLPIRLQLQDLLTQIPEEDQSLQNRATYSAAGDKGASWSTADDSATYSVGDSSATWSEVDNSATYSLDTSCFSTETAEISGQSELKTGGVKGVGGGGAEENGGGIKEKKTEAGQNEEKTKDMNSREMFDGDGIKRKNYSHSNPTEAVAEETRAPHGVPSKKPKKSAHKQQDERLFKLQKSWRQTEFAVTCLEGHNDLVVSVALEKDWVLTGSRDTMMKLWDGSTGKELHSFGGHSDCVTAVLFIPKEDSSDLAGQYELAEDDRLLVSGSMDCAVRLWSLKTGAMVKSVYTYNPVTCLTYYTNGRLLVTGSSGGKVEIWSLATGENIHSLIAFDGATTSLRVDKDRIYSASEDGFIKIFTVKEGKLSLLFESDDVKGVDEEELSWRHIRSLATSNDTIYYGDDGSNVKVLSWKKGVVHKLKNHVCEFGSTDAMSAIQDDILLTSGYDLDNGAGYINVRSLPEEQYISTLSDKDTGRIMCVGCTHLPHGAYRVVAAGTDLKIWEQIKTGMKIVSPLPVDHTIVTSHYNPKFAATPQNSDVDSDTETDEEEVTGLWARFTGSGRGTVASRSHRGDEEDEDEDQSEARRWWCNLL